MKNHDQIDKMLGEPFFDDFTENDYRIRRNLIFFSTISLAVIFSDFTVIESKGILGLPISGLNQLELLAMLSIAILYHLIHFLACYIRKRKRWKLRLTAKQLSFRTSSAGTWGGSLGDNEDAPSPAQATLYSWWINYRIHFKNAVDVVSKIEAEGKSEDLPKELSDVRDKLRTLITLFENGGVETRLKRFDEDFKKMLTYQYAIWISVEVLLPIGLGVASLFFLASALFPTALVSGFFLQ